MQYSIIDVDSHVTEPPDVWTSRVAKRHVERVPQVRRIDGADIWFLDGERIAEVGSTAPAGTSFVLPEMPRTYDDILPAAYDANARLALLDDEGIWAQLLYPNVGGFGGQKFLRLGDRELMYECVRAYNDWQLEWASADDARLIPVASMPFWDVDECVREVHRCAAAGFRTILFTGEPHRFDLPYLGDPHWDPLWSVVSEAGMPVNLHVGGGAMEWDVRRTEQRGFAETFAIEGLGLFHKNGQQVCDVLLSGILPRHPALRIVSVESGIGWLPFALEAIDYQFVEGGGPRTRPEFARLPSEYLAGQVFVTCWFEHFAIRELVGKVIAPGSVLFETDFPHPTSLHGNIQQQLARMFDGVDDATRHQILWDNAIALYGIEAPATVAR
jgi:predicted TIM-barrel fold metal-dependent hydrolase